MALQKGPVLPTIIIDEANQLQQRKATEANQLEALLRFFVLVTKEAKLAHVVLATSEPLFELWLGDSTLFLQLPVSRSMLCCTAEIMPTLPKVIAWLVPDHTYRVLMWFRSRSPSLYSQGHWRLHRKACQGIFCTHCLPILSMVLVSSYEWHKIWEVCGGRPKLLLACAERAAETLSWPEGMLPQ